MQDSKNIISLRLEQSRVSEKIEELRQLILLSTLPQTKILRLNDTLDMIQLNVDGGYEEKFIAQRNIGNIWNKCLKYTINVLSVVQKIWYSKRVVIHVKIVFGLVVQLPKCPNCSKTIDYKNYTFSGLSKKYFCTSCWYRIYSLYKGLEYAKEDYKIWEWISLIKRNSQD